MPYENANEDLRAIKSLYDAGAISNEEAESMCQFVEGLA